MLVKLSFAVVCLTLMPSLALGQLSSSEDYRIGPEDVIAIQVWGRDDLTGSVTVDFNGRIQVPLLGEINAAGRTPAELHNDLTDRLQLIDRTIPEVLVSVEEYVSRSVSVIGAVNSPDTYGFRDMPTLWEAILEAGGPRSDAEMALVQVVRANPGPDQPATVTVDLSRGIEGTPIASLPELYPKDRVVVPEVEDTPITVDRYHVIGAVRAPGVYRLNTAHNVVEALSVSGGPLPTAQLDGVYLSRLTDYGTVSYKLNLNGHLRDAVPLQDLGLQAGDTIMVPERASWFGSFTDVVRGITPIVSLLIAGYVASTR